MWSMRSVPQSDGCTDLWKSYIADREAEGVNTKQLEYRWRKLEPFFGYKMGNAITKDDCKAYTKQRLAEGSSPSPSAPSWCCFGPASI